MSNTDSSQAIPSPRARVLGTHWRTKPIKSPTSAKWNIPLSYDDLVKIIAGFDAQVMEERWRCVAHGPDENGLVKVHFYRSWTGYERCVLTIQTVLGDDGDIKDGQGARIVGIMWETREGDDKGEASEKEIALGVCNWTLGCSLVDEEAGSS